MVSLYTRPYDGPFSRINLQLSSPARGVERRFRVSGANGDAALKSIKGGGDEAIIRYCDASLRFRERHADARSIPQPECYRRVQRGCVEHNRTALRGGSI